MSIHNICLNGKVNKKYQYFSTEKKMTYLELWCVHQMNRIMFFHHNFFTFNVLVVACVISDFSDNRHTIQVVKSLGKWLIHNFSSNLEKKILNIIHD